MHGTDLVTTMPDVARWRRRPLATGLAAGVLWGAVLRLWMASLSTDPSFTLSGTSIILVACGLTGLSIGAVHRLAGGGRTGLSRLSGLGIVLLGPQGLPIIGTVIPAAIGIARDRWPTWLRVVVGLAAGIVPVLLFRGVVEDIGTVRAALSTVWYVVMVAVLAVPYSMVFRARPRPDAV